MSAVMAPAKLASASPASRITVRLVRLPAISTSAPTESSAPRMPATGTISEVAENNPKAMTKDEVAAAACGAPNKAGSASGLRNSPCKAAPERPSVAPISTASKVRGSRISRTMIAAGPSPMNNASSAVRTGSPAGPTTSETTISASTRSASAALSRRPDFVIACMDGH